MANNNSGGKASWAVPIVVALITAAGGIIVALISNRAGQSTGQQQAFATAAIQQSTSVAQAASTQIVITSPPVVITSEPIVVTSPPIVITSPPIVVTSPPAVVTAAPAPTPTPPETTPPGTILEVGQTWKEGGAELTLKDVQLSPGQVPLVFEFTNRKSDQIAVTFIRAKNLFASDNNKRKLETCYDPISYGCDNDRSYVISPGDTVQIISTNREQLPMVIVDTTKPDLTEIIVKVTGFSSITDAQWRIPINH